MTKTAFAYLECGTDFRITQWNPVAETLFGYTRDEVMGRPCTELIARSDNREAFQGCWHRILAGEVILTDPVAVLTKSGATAICEWYGAPIRDAQGRPIGIAALAQDVSRHATLRSYLDDTDTIEEAKLPSLSTHVAVLDSRGIVIAMNTPTSDAAAFASNPLFARIRIGTDYLAALRVEAEAQRALQPALRQLERAFDGRADEGAVEYGIEGPSGPRWFLMSTHSLLSPECGCLVSHRDVSERKAQEEGRLLHRVFQDIGEGLLILDRRIRIASLNRTFTRLTGLSASHLIGRRPNVVIPCRSNARLYHRIGLSLRKSGVCQGRLSARCLPERIAPLWFRVHVVRNERGEVTHYLCACAASPEQQGPDDAMYTLVYRDVLTDLPNRALLRERMRQALAKARRHRRPMALLCINLDRFHLINGTLGHEIGDEILRKVGARLQGAVRESDTVTRLAGDEFIVLIDELSQASDAARVAQKIIRSLTAPIESGPHEIYPTASIGISVFPDDADSEIALLQHADTAMHRIKPTGGNSYQFFSEQMNASSAERLWLENGLRKAMHAGQLELHYQPIIDLRTGEISKVEALLRWRDLARGWIPPGTFIPIAEETGLIHPLSAWVLTETCRQHAEWRLAGFDRLTATVNFSALQFRQPDVVSLVQQVLERTELSPEGLEIELTESSLMQNPEGTIEILRGLKAIGIRVAIDDFGTGYSSLSYLRRFPIDIVKIDRSFVADIHRDREDLAITAAIVAMAHQLRLDVVAEGVETEEQLSLLRNLGCDLAQGFYFSRAVSGREVPTVCIRARNVDDQVPQPRA